MRTTLKLFTIIVLLTVYSTCLRAQKKEISQARTYIKSGKDFDKAAKLMQELIEKDSASRRNPKVYEIWFDAVKHQYDQGNEKLYLKEKYDTTALYGYTKSMFAILCSLDSVETLLMEEHSKKGVPKSRKKNAETLHRFRPNLFHAGTHYYRNADFAKAYSFFATYVESTSKPLFESYDWAKDRRVASAAFWATACGNKMQDPELTLRFAPIAENDTTRLRLTLRYESEAYLRQKDDAHYVETLRRGMRRFPKHEYFFTRIMDFYTDNHLPDSALNVTNEALAMIPDCNLFLFAKSTVLLNLGRNDECISVTKQLIEQCDSLSEPYYNIGCALLNKALLMEERHRRNREEIKALYSEARPYMERYRLLEPNQTKKWAPALYRIYLNLNMGEQFEEIDNILSNM